MKNIRLRTALITLFTTAAMLLSGCVSGEGERSGDGSGGHALKGQVLNIDFATYNPLSLIIKKQGWLEAQGVTVNWVQSAGSNKANEALRAGAIDVGSTAGSAALLARSNGSPIKVIAIYSQPEWAALVAPKGSTITSVEQLRGKNVAATKGTDPYFFLLQALEAHGLTAKDVTVQNLQHADGWAALQNGSVDAWAGLDPIMAGAEQTGATLFYRDIKLNSYGFLDAREDFLAKKPELAQAVVDAYATAAAWAAANPDETARILADAAGLDPAVAEKVIRERSNLGVDQVPGPAQLAVLEKIGPIFVDLGDVPNQRQVDDALGSIVDDRFAKQANAARFQ
ncbi:aliphatic sulfonate ABC transporter substrate-binding protein [Mycolicibacterium sp.]|uniref:aliphatic sulfonate ABC transporter substrate-binding protein n=1 Tax=Mycolicibacterium sp. TaxID=2320850 RepID=UPI001A1AC4F7|nr:aliphatic sulfonate ABC transporter substrate-binding protein [Mycolicibacterium sp.]MBJ7337042.1 aliphatic sulfonate ABC transporter substrate-binding protein [Mycolicibacterium sp.]